MIRSIKHFLRLTFLYVTTRFIYIFKRPPKVLGSLESLEKINKEKLSISRYGDGEFLIINGKSIKFQDYDPVLSKRLKEILYVKENKFYSCIPAIYKYKQTRNLKYNEEVFWLNEILYYGKNYLNKEYKNKLYLDACLSRPYIRYKDTSISKSLFKEIKKIWDKEDIVIVEGKYSRLGVGNDLFSNAKSVKRILCPNKNAFAKYEKILKETLKYKDKLVLIALGPTATVLAYDLFKNNVRALDLGHLDLEYEWYLSGAKEKQIVKNKIVNETNETNEINEIKEKEYLDSILKEIR